MPILQDHRFRGALLVALLLSGCSGGTDLLLPGDGQPANIRVEHGNGLSGRVGEPLGDSLVFAVTDSRGRGVEGARIAFDLTSVADVVPDTAQTNANGLADVRLVLGTSVGQQVGEARVVVPEGSREPTTTFTVMALPENANGMTALSGDAQSGPAGSTLSQPLVVEVTDAFGNPISGVQITWTAEGGGTVSEAANLTDGDGHASVLRTLGSVAGAQSTVATSEGLVGSPLTFSHTATAGNAAGLSIVSGDGQTAAAGTELPGDLVVQLVDADGNGVPGAAVTWVIGTGNGRVSPENTITDEAGRTSARWTLGPQPGENRVDVVVSGVAVINFRAIGTSVAPAALSIVTQPSSSTRNAARLDRQPVVQVRDGRPGVLITAQLAGGGGELLGTRVVATDASGRATFTDLAIAGAAGLRTLVFTASGYAGATSNPIEVRAIPTLTSITSDSPDPSAVGATVTVGFRVSAEGVVPLGTVTVTDGVQSCSGTLSAGAGSCQLPLTTSGRRTLRATYAGSPGLNSSSDIEEHTVNASSPPPGNEPPDADYNYHCEGLTCDFTDRSTDRDGRVIAWSWNFGDGSPESQQQNPTHTYAGPATYTVILTATDDGGARNVSSASVEVEAPPPPPPGGTSTTITGDTPDPSDPGVTVTVSFRVTSSSGTPTGPVNVTDEQGGSCTGQAPSGSCTYVPGGTGTRTITAHYEGNSSFNGSSGAAQHTVREPPPPPENRAPHAEFDVTCDNNLSCTFTDRSTDDDGSIVTRSWNYGDGSPASSTPSHTYAAPGTYEVTLTVTDNAGASDSKSHDAKPEAPPPPPENRAPHAEFDVHCTDLTCTFTDRSTDEDGTITSRVWNYGDGSAVSSTPSHTYAAPGNYDVTLTVTDNAGASDSETHEARAEAPPPPPPASTTTTITSDSPDPSDPGVAIAVSFSVTASSGTPSGQVTVSDQNGGGCTGNAPSGSCSYTPSGTGARTITATYSGNSSFNESSDTETHTVNEPPPPPPANTTTTITGDDPDPSDPGVAITVSFTVTASSGTPNGQVTISDQNGGGCTGNAPSGSCSYTPSGTGARTIMAGYSGNSSFNGSTDTETHTVNEPPPPNGAPTAVIGSISCSGMSCTFTDASTDPNGSETIEQWNWLFGDGDSSSERNPSHDYAVAGDYTVTLTVADDHNETDTVDQDLTVQPPAGSPRGTGALIAKARQS